MMYPKIFLRAGLLASLTALLCAGGPTSKLGNEDGVAADAEKPLPQEILDGEAAYQEQLHAHMANQHRFQLSTMDLEPEKRRELLKNWQDAHRSELEAQAKFSEELDLLYVKHGIPTAPDHTDYLRWMESTKPPSAADPGSEEGKKWTLRRELAEIKQNNAKNPEQLRDRMAEWLAANGEALLPVEQGKGSQSQKNGNEKAARPKMALVAPPGASKEAKFLFELQNRLMDMAEANPSTLRKSPDATYEEMDAWREASSEKSQAVMQAIQTLSQEMSKKENIRIAKENPYEPKK